MMDLFSVAIVESILTKIKPTWKMGVSFTFGSIYVIYLAFSMEKVSERTADISFYRTVIIASNESKCERILDILDKVSAQQCCQHTIWSTHT